MKHFCILVLGIFFSFSGFVIAESATWSMNDVEVAHKEKNFVELERHILSIPPSARNSNWVLALRDTLDYQMSSLSTEDRFLVNMDTLALLKPYLTSGAFSYDFLVKVGKFLRLHTQRHANALEWFKYAFDQDAQKQQLLCADEDLRLAVIDGLHLGPDDVLVKNAVYFANLCYSQLSPSIKESLPDANEYGIKNICPLLRSHKDLTGSLIELRCKEFGV